nr:hypothetical protein L203_06561 [Cryptococcus depauperatus CBS 7841]
MSYYTTYPYCDFNYPTHRRVSSPIYYHTSVEPFRPPVHIYAKPEHDFDEIAALEQEERAAVAQLKAIQRRREELQAAKAREAAARAKAQVEREEAIRVELARAIAKEAKRKQEEEKRQEEERKRKAYAEAVAREKAEMRAIRETERSGSQRGVSKPFTQRQAPKIESLDDINKLLGAFFGINVAPQEPKISDNDDPEHESLPSVLGLPKDASSPNTKEAEQSSSSLPEEQPHIPSSGEKFQLDLFDMLKNINEALVQQTEPKQEKKPEATCQAGVNDDQNCKQPESATQSQETASQQQTQDDSQQDGPSELATSFATLQNMEDQLTALITSYTLQTRLAFAHTTPGSHPPPLLFNRLNAPYHAQINALLQLLLQADSIDSKGDKDLRRRRKQLVKDVESEIEKLEKHRDELWEEVKGKRERGEESEPDEDEERSWSDASSVAEELEKLEPKELAVA